MIELNLSWFLFYGRKLNMNRREIMATKVGEMRDMIACLYIYHGAKPKRTQHKLSFLETLEVT